MGRMILRIKMREVLHRHKQYLLTGVSYVIPVIACGGILIALTMAYAFHAHLINKHGGPDPAQGPWLVRNMYAIGKLAFRLFPVVLAGFIAYAMAGKPGLVPGFIGGLIAAMPQTVDGHVVNAGFLGALIIGLLAGHLVNVIKKTPIPKLLRPVMPIIFIPILSAVPVGLLMLTLNQPIGILMVRLDHFLHNMQAGSQIILAMVLGAMIAFDMGGPVNKTAFFFGVAMIQQNNFTIMGACAAAICIPPLGLGMATLMNRKLWNEEQREAGLAALGMGMIGITEGAIPFAAADPVRVIPATMFGSMTASVIAMLGHVGDHAPHGGLVVLPVVDNKLNYILAILTGVIITAVTINVVKIATEKSTFSSS